MSAILSSLLSLLGASIRHRLARPDSRPTAAGAAVYSPLFLNLVYDRLVLGAYCTYVWRCPASAVESLYGRLIGGGGGGEERRGRRVLDVGVGTGYFLASSPLPAGAQVTLFDLNPACLDAASARCREAHAGVPGLEVEAACGDFLAGEDDPASIRRVLGGPGRPRFDVVLASMLLHCVPGPPGRKAAALASLAGLVEPASGVLAGATILGSGGGGADEVRHGLPGRFVMFWHNALGMFDNERDDAATFVGALAEAFHDVEWEVVGAVLIFEARRPKS